MFPMLFQDTNDGLFFDADKCFIATIIPSNLNPLALEKNDMLDLKVVRQKLLGDVTYSGIIKVVFKHYDPRNNVVFCRIDAWSLK